MRTLTLPLLLACAASAAPLPFPRPAPPPEGEYTLSFHGSLYAAVLHRGGAYEAWAGPRVGPAQWAGEWRQEGASIRVAERMLAPGEPPAPPWATTWSAPVVPPGHGGPGVWLTRNRKAR
jgi:hypothetical protein